MATAETLSEQNLSSTYLEVSPEPEANNTPIPDRIPESYWEAARERKRLIKEAAQPAIDAANRPRLLHHKGDLARKAFHLSKTGKSVVVRFVDDGEIYAGKCEGLRDTAVHQSQALVVNRVLFAGLGEEEQVATNALAPPHSKDIQMVEAMWTRRELVEAISDCVFGKADPQLTNPPLFVTI